MDRLRQFYDTVAAWCYLHPEATDFIVVFGVIGSLLLIQSLRTRRRRRIHRLLWGMKMRRSRNRLAYEKSSIAMALEDHLFEEVYAGNMTQQSADEWRHSFANRYQMDELLPRKDQKTVKRAIRNRINSGIHRVQAIIPGGPPKVKIDPTYKPVVAVPGEMIKKSTSRSKYATAS
jgi:hypothetical protein